MGLINKSIHKQKLGAIKKRYFKHHLNVQMRDEKSGMIKKKKKHHKKWYTGVLKKFGKFGGDMLDDADKLIGGGVDTIGGLEKAGVGAFTTTTQFPKYLLWAGAGLGGLLILNATGVGQGILSAGRGVNAGAQGVAMLQ
jgi:hypothetical protein